MAEYIIGAVIIVAVILALRSYFGSKYGDGSHCSGCSGCSRAAQCGLHAKETVDKTDK